MSAGRAGAARGGFTLLEVMVVVLVLGLLAALVGPQIFGRVSEAKTTTAGAQLELLGVALDNYRLDNGFYPTTEQGLAALREKPAQAPVPASWRGPYLRKAVPMDPWGRPYLYRSPLEGLPPALLEAFEHHEWRGNVRELENTVRRYVILPDLEAALAEIRRATAATAAGERARPAAPAARRREERPRQSLKEAASQAASDVERRLIHQTLEDTRWNRREAARRLEISYKALLNKMKRWDIGTGAVEPC